MENLSNIYAVKGKTLSQVFIYKLLSRIEYGQITLIENNEINIFSGHKNVGAYKVTVTLHNKNLFRNLFFTGTNGAADSYIQGDWEADNLSTLIEIILMNRSIFNGIDNIFSSLMSGCRNFLSSVKKNHKTRSKKNILAHYDLGNEFFQLFLDKHTMYSCAVYESPLVSLDNAAAHKLALIAEYLQLNSQDHILEIGCGWGGFAIYAAQKFGCKVTTTTISDLQYDFVKNKIQQLGLQNQIELLNKDYRELRGQYDKLISIEMIEAVGHQFFDRFFKKCNALLKPGGLFFLQAITINESAYEKAKNEIDFIKRYIFPGGCLPSVGRINEAIVKHTSLQLLQWRDIGLHYAKTLLDWRARFYENLSAVKNLGFNDAFIRAWDLYFCYSAAGFQQRYISDIHGLWRKQLQ
jgi:cyclopropane-fatty-acyl-phospholipid synthase